MRATAESDAMIDPVCGAPVGVDSLYRRAHAGALYCFCSARCLDQFVVDPLRYALLAAAKGGGQARRIDTEVTVPVQRPELGVTGAQSVAPSRRPDTFPTIEVGTLPLMRPITGTSGQAPRFPVASPAFAGGLNSVQNARAGAGLWDFLEGLLPWREQRFARRVSRELVKLYRIVAAGHPGLHGRDLYRQIVMARTRADPQSADALVDQAEESFAAWPVRRAVKFSDVVHFIAVSEFLATHGNSPWIRANVGRVVDSQIPHDL